jgi:hypothetical protein
MRGLDLQRQYRQPDAARRGRESTAMTTPPGLYGCGTSGRTARTALRWRVHSRISARRQIELEPPATARKGVERPVSLEACLSGGDV